MSKINFDKVIPKRNNKPKKKPVCANISLKTYEKLDALAKKHSTFKSKIAEIILEEYFKGKGDVIESV